MKLTATFTVEYETEFVPTDDEDRQQYVMEWMLDQAPGQFSVGPGDEDSIYFDPVGWRLDVPAWDCDWLAVGTLADSQNNGGEWISGKWVERQDGLEFVPDHGWPDPSTIHR